MTGTTTAGVTRRLLALSVSALVVLAAEPTYVLVDTAVVGHLGATPLGGLAVAGALMALLTVVGTFVEYGTTARAARWFGAGRADDAISTYQSVLSGKLEGRLRFLAIEGLGYAQEAKGDLTAASATFAKLGTEAGSDKEGGFYKDRAVYHQARLAELRGNAGDAKKLYREVLDKNPNTSLRADITNRLAVLELK